MSAFTVLRKVTLAVFNDHWYIKGTNAYYMQLQLPLVYFFLQTDHIRDSIGAAGFFLLVESKIWWQVQSMQMSVKYLARYCLR